MNGSAVEFSVFGRIEALVGGHPVDLGGRQPRAILASLLASANRVVPTERLIDQLWGETPPTAAGGTLHVYISNLRRAFEPDRPPRSPAQVLVTHPPGYVLHVAPAAFDVARFEDAVAEGRALLAAGRPGPAAGQLTAALAVWRGTPYAELASEPWLVAEVARLDERRAAATEDLAEARLALGEAGAAVADLEQLVAAEPLRERAWELLALALYRSGRQAEALRALADLRRTLADELGLDPRPSVAKLEGDILRHAPELEGDAGGGPDQDGYLEIWTDLGRQVVTLRTDRVTVGRSSSSDVHVPDAMVSRLHAVVERIPDGWAIADAGSANGTFVNGEPVTAGRALTPGDQIALGGSRLIFRSRAADAAAETVAPAPAADAR